MHLLFEFFGTFTVFEYRFELPIPYELLPPAWLLPVLLRLEEVDPYDPLVASFLFAPNGVPL